MDHQIWVPSKSGAEFFLKSYNFFLTLLQTKRNSLQTTTYQYLQVKKKSLLFKSGAKFTQILITTIK